MHPGRREQHVADLLETMDAEGIERCDVVGHSFGGLLATHLAATAPERVGKVVLLDPAIAQSGQDMLEAAEETAPRRGLGQRGGGPGSAGEGRPPQALPFVEADLDEALERGEDGRYRLRYCRSTVVTAWSEMARPPAALDGFGGELLLVPALHDGMVTAALRGRARARPRRSPDRARSSRPGTWSTGTRSRRRRRCCGRRLAGDEA